MKALLPLLVFLSGALAVLASAVAASPGSGRMDDWQAIEDSLRAVQPKFREQWLREHGFEWPGHTAGPVADSGLTLLGKWGRGPAVEVTGLDTLVALSLGSEVALLDFARPDSPRVLAEIQLSSMAGQARLAGNRLYTNSTGAFEAWDITDPGNPVRLGGLDYGIGDFQVFDTLLFFIKADTFRTYSVAEPAAMYQLGACRDSGYFLAATEEMAVLGHSAHGLYFIDVSDPANPHRAGAYSTDLPRSAELRGNLCCATVESGVYPYPIRFLALDISNPASPHLLGTLQDAGGYDLHLDGPYAFASGRDQSKETFHIISVADSAHPTVVGQCRTTNRYNWGVWADLDQDLALVADEYDGLAVVDIGTVASPVLDGYALVAASAEDVAVDGRYCYVANGAAGMKILDALDPAAPAQVGEIDTTYDGYWCFSATARDSFAYMTWLSPYLQSVDVSDPTRPQLVGGCPAVEGLPRDMVLRDSLLYLALNYQFAVVNVARPRQPQVVGTCNLQNMATCLCVSGTLAYVGSWPSPAIDISDPTQPTVVYDYPMPLGGIAVEDTLAYFAQVYDSMHVYSVANPAQPVRLGSLDLSGGVPFGQWNSGLVKVDTVVYIGGRQMKAVSVADPGHPREIAPRWQPPSQAVRRLEYAAPYLYAACSDGGVCILETLQVGVAEEQLATKKLLQVSVAPTVTDGRVPVTVEVASTPASVALYDGAGRRVAAIRVSGRTSGRLPSGALDLSRLPPGVYVVEVRTNQGVATGKVVRTAGR